MPQPPRPPSKGPAPKGQPASQLDETAMLLAAVLGSTSEETSSFQAVFKALDQPGKRVVLELPWYADGGTHQLILKERQGNRVAFYNALGHAGKGPGDMLTDGLKRRVEPDGTESAELSDLEALFRAGKARALITQAGSP